MIEKNSDLLALLSEFTLARKKEEQWFTSFEHAGIIPKNRKESNDTQAAYKRTSACAHQHIFTPLVLSPLIVNLSNEHPQKQEQKVALGHLPEQGEHAQAVDKEYDSHLCKVSLPRKSPRQTMYRYQGWPILQKIVRKSSEERPSEKLQKLTVTSLQKYLTPQTHILIPRARVDIITALGFRKGVIA